MIFILYFINAHLYKIKMEKFVAYTRVSTLKQSHGLDSQLDIINNWIKNRVGEVIHFLEEKVSGKINERPELAKAIEICKKENATLLIAKLDRLSRNVSFLFQIKDSGINIACCDLPELNTLTLGIFATMAQHERELISRRTKEGLKIAKEKGKKIGRKKGYIRNKDITQKINIAKRQKAILRNERIYKIILHLKNKDLGNHQIAKELNMMGFTAPRGGQFQSNQIRQIMDIFC
jgi:DNA invertase Pin-like site-specific DNA recombinase